MKEKVTLKRDDSDSSHDVEREVRACVPPHKLKASRLAQEPKRLLSDPVSNVLSYLGPRNPFPQSVTPSDEVWLFDNTAFPVTTNHNGRKIHKWKAEFVTAVFSQHPSCTVREVVLQMADKIGLADDEEAKATMAERLKPFLMDIQPGKRVTALHGEQRVLKLGPGGRSGISADTKNLSSPAPPGMMMVPTTAKVPKGTTGMLTCKTFYAAAQDGWGVICDVDDTIKITLTDERLGILQSTFVDEAMPVEGMPELFRFLRQQVNASAAPFFYLSASPYNLYSFLRKFRDDYYPHGQLMLRHSSWMSLPGLLSNLTMGTQDYKVAQMRKIHKWFPRKKMICVGDSTQTDPEAYGAMYRQYGHRWIKLILIRKVMGVVAVGVSMEEKNTRERFEEAFTGVPKGVWYVFEKPEECYEIIQGVVGEK